MQLHIGFFYKIVMLKINPIKFIKECFATSIMVFELQLHRQLSNWCKKCVQPGLS
jgi:hypothetical protein